MPSSSHCMCTVYTVLDGKLSCFAFQTENSKRRKKKWFWTVCVVLAQNVCTYSTASRTRQHPTIVVGASYKGHICIYDIHIPAF